MKILSVLGTLVMVLIIFSSCKKEQVENLQREDIMCRTTYGDFVPCSELEQKEANHSSSGFNTKANYDFVWSECTYTDERGRTTDGGKCTEEEDGGCTDEHECLPCANC
jgi:hypothetical protein